jgi:RND family efflux transporter MFP subunit
VTENSIKEVETALELANTVYEKQKQLWNKNIGSELDYLQAKNNKESLESKLETLNAQAEMALIRAPISGIVDEILVKEGELAAPGMQVVQLVNLDGLYINADVSEAYITKVKKGDIVSLEFPSLPEIEMEVTVFRTGNIVKSANRTFKVQLKINNVENMIKPNILAKIKINDYTKDQAILVPSIILKQDMEGTYLFTVVDSKAKKVYVETGKSYKGKTIISKGLKTGDKVIVEGYNQVSDGKVVAEM